MILTTIGKLSVSFCGPVSSLWYVHSDVSVVEQSWNVLNMHLSKKADIKATNISNKSGMEVWKLKER